MNAEFNETQRLMANQLLTDMAKRAWAFYDDGDEERAEVECAAFFHTLNGFYKDGVIKVHDYAFFKMTYVESEFPIMGFSR